MSDMPPPVTHRKQLLKDAIQLVSSDRNSVYGPPTENFERIAALWTIIFQRPFAPHEVAMAMACVKLSRLVVTPNHQDGWTDLAGYAAIGWECAST